MPTARTPGSTPVVVPKPNVPIGPTTIAGWFASVVAFLPAAVNEVIAFVENHQAQLSGSEKGLAFAGLGVLVITLVGRYLQSLKS